MADGLAIEAGDGQHLLGGRTQDHFVGRQHLGLGQGAQVVGDAFFLAQIVVSKGTWLGGGDLRIGAFMGLILGWKLALVALFFSYLLGSVISISLMITGHLTRKSQVPFGPFLMLGTLVALFFGNTLIQLYWTFVGL